VIWDLHHKLSKHITIYEAGEAVKVTGYAKIFMELKKLLK
jgi:hypothetical protein